MRRATDHYSRLGDRHVTATDRTHPPPPGTWTIDPAHSNVSFVWRRLDRPGFGVGAQAWSFDSQIQLELVLRARRVVTATSTQRQEQEKVTCTTSMLG